MSQRLSRWWYKRYLVLPLWFAIPLNWLFVFVATMRRLAFRIGLKRSWKAPVPVIVVGNISAGGTGKTPVVVGLVRLLQQQGLRPAIVSRGYGGQGPFPQRVSATSDPAQVGDEPVMLATMTQVPVAVSPDRPEACRLLLESEEVDVIITDDGLQHYALKRDIEIAVVDGKRGFGNGWRMPVGPLRESVRRLKRTDWVLVNGIAERDSRRLEQLHALTVNMVPGGWRSVKDGSEIEVPDGENALAIAGIGHPERFFSLLREQNVTLRETRVYPDHYAYQPSDFFRVSNEYPVLMTEKDAVKCREFARPHWYYLKVEADFPKAFSDGLISKLNTVLEHKHSKEGSADEHSG